MADDALLVVETKHGVAVRRIMPASVLQTGRAKGMAAEDATRGAAAIWGLPDFIFRPRTMLRGAGSRELGDTIVAVTGLAAAVQIKSRLDLTQNPARERAWLDKQIEHAVRQATGTIRTIARQGGATLENERGRSLRVSVEDRPWIKVVVLDHPGFDGYVPVGDAVVLLRRDWEFLFEQLKSTAAVLGYLRRVGTSEHVALGAEPVRYYQFALADEAAPAGPIDVRLAALDSVPHSSPLLPTAPAGHGQEQLHYLIRDVLEDLAVVGQIDEQARFDMLSAVDAIPVTYRAELGADILRWIDEVADAPEGKHAWHIRGIPYADGPYVLFATASKYSEEVDARFRDFVSLRHQQLLDLIPERGPAITVGILLTRRTDGVRPWDTTAVATRGDQGFSTKWREALEILWGPLGTHAWPEPDWDAVAQAFADAAEEP